MPRPTVDGDAPFVERIMTGLHSFDRAFINRKGDLGFPIGKGTEVFGATHCGKSTIVYGLAGIIAKEKSIALADLEGFDPEFLGDVLETIGYKGTITYIEEEDDEKVLDKLVVMLRDEKYGVGILDSIGAISPVSEQVSTLGEANMGRRAFLMAQFSRKILKVLRDHYPKTLFMINHFYPKVAGRGMVTPGGNVKNYIISMRIQMNIRYKNHKYQQYPDGSYVIEGKVVKNRWGIKDKKFLLFVLSGRGIHKGMTAIFDCENEDLLEIKRNVVKVGDKSYGNLRKIADEAQQGNDEFFQPFLDLLSLEKDDSTNDETKRNNE